MDNESKDSVEEVKSVKERIAAIRAEREAIAAKDAEAAELRAANEELQREQHALALAQALPELVAKHGELGSGLVVVNTRLGAAVFKRPVYSRWKAYQDTAIKTGVNSNEVEKIVRACRVYPSDAAFDVLIEELPAACGNAFIGAINILAGARAEETEGK